MPNDPQFQASLPAILAKGEPPLGSPRDRWSFLQIPTHATEAKANVVPNGNRETPLDPPPDGKSPLDVFLLGTFFAIEIYRKHGALCGARLGPVGFTSEQSNLLASSVATR